MLQSRLCEQLWMHVCEPFPAKRARTFMRTLNSAEWRGFIPFSARLPLPYVRVNAKDSELYHTGMIRKMVHEVIRGHCHKSVELQGDELPATLQRRGHLPVCPTLMVNIDGNECEVLANASGDLCERPWTSASAVDARISPSAVSAIAHRIEILDRIAENRITTIWDPLCHNGALLLELHSFLRGHRARAIDHVYPLNNFPLNSRGVFENALDSPVGRAYTGPQLRLLGTDVLQGHLADASACLEQYRNFDLHGATDKRGGCDDGGKAPPKVDVANALPTTATDACPVSLTFSSDSLSEVDLDSKSTLILTNMYYGDKGRRKEFLDAHRRFEAFLARAPRQLLQNVYVVATENIRKLSKFTWEPELRFNNGGVLVSLLKLRGTKV
ncbi:RNA methylase family UPF0020 protein [Babesia caballi]|uniref:RNA methylase family UPF0020 protein n=1 Tax=Babesia caballi TaxID=5871 RepID=A0AAV4LNW6_BABCB|nr:RNA methylase family UPF0020 protein [Babesia caballi]